MGIQMVGTVNFVGQTSQASISSYRAVTNQVSSVDALQGDPDLLIKEYFLASPKQRANLRKLIAARLKTSRSFLTILGWSQLPSTKDGYDGAVDLLAECHSQILFQETCDYLITLSRLANTNHDGAKLEQCEAFWGVFLKGIGCAYLLSPPTKLRLLQRVALPLQQLMNRRSVKAVLLDALEIVLEEGGEGLVWGKEYIQFLAEYDRDQYIRTYAQTILANLD
jgi:hypothetical protein